MKKWCKKCLNKNADATQIIDAINKLRADFSTIISEAKLIEQPTDELEKWFNKIVESIENIRVPSEKYYLIMQRMVSVVRCTKTYFNGIPTKLEYEMDVDLRNLLPDIYSIIFQSGIEVFGTLFIKL